MVTTTELANDLNDLLKGEISACETYKQALEKITTPSIREVLQKNHECHAGRVEVLKKEVMKSGGEPSQGSGIWGSFAKLMEGGATMLGDKSAVSVLEEGEDKGLADYKKYTEKYGTSASVLIDLKSKQESSHLRCRDLKHSLV